MLNSCPLYNISNKRLARLKEKTFGWRYRVIHIKASKLIGPNALSRIPNNAAKLQLLETNETINAQLKEEEDDDNGNDGCEGT